MKPLHPKIGVSPALLLSAYGPHYTPENVCEAMEKVAAWGFTNIQIEIYDEDKIELWLEGDGAKKVKKVAEGLGLNISQLVGHLLIDDCASPSALFSSSGIATMEKLVVIADSLERVESITLPIGPFVTAENGEDIAHYISDAATRGRLIRKLSEFGKPVEAVGYRLAIELLPRNVFGGYQGFAEIQRDVPINRFGLLFDTGHAWAALEDVYSIPTQFKGSIFGTHLCDNFGDESMKLAPGKGAINWEVLMRNFDKTKFQGFFDIEIKCSAVEVEAQYCSSLAFIYSFLCRG